jgi:hypothetical protein
MELDFQSFFGLLWSVVLIGWDPAPPPTRPHLGSYTRLLLVSQDALLLFNWCLFPKLGQSGVYRAPSPQQLQPSRTDTVTTCALQPAAILFFLSLFPRRGKAKIFDKNSWKTVCRLLKAGSLKKNTALEYSTRVVQEGGRRCKKSTLNDLVHLTPLRIPSMNPP